MTKNQVIFEHVVVTFFEAIGAYLIANQTDLSGKSKAVAIGAIGFGLSAAYNVLRQSNPTLPSLPPTESPENTPPLPTTVITPTEPGQGSGPDGNPVPGQPG